MGKALKSIRWPILLIAAAVTTAHAESAKIVRLAVVNTPQFSGLLDFLLPEFEAKTGLTLEVYSGNDVYQQARAGKADIDISHYGRHEVESFVLEGYGSWPKIEFANQAVLSGPKNDPARIRGLSSTSEALSRIARVKAPFIANNSKGAGYLTRETGFSRRTESMSRLPCWQKRSKAISYGAPGPSCASAASANRTWKCWSSPTRCSSASWQR